VLVGGAWWICAVVGGRWTVSLLVVGGGSAGGARWTDDSQIINQINFVSIFKCKGKCVKLQFYQLKKIQFQSHSSHHSQTFINFPYTFHSIYLNPNILTFFTLSLQIILNSLSHFHSLIQTKP